MRGISILLFILVLCMAATLGCTMPATTPSAPAATAPPAVTQAAAPAANGAAITIDIIASSFDPQIVNARVGDTVTWVNKDKMAHRVEHLPALPNDPLLFRSESLSPGQSFSYTFTQPGRYKYGDPQHAGGSSTYLVIVE